MFSARARRVGSHVSRRETEKCGEKIEVDELRDFFLGNEEARCLDLGIHNIIEREAGSWGKEDPTEKMR